MVKDAKVSVMVNTVNMSSKENIPEGINEIHKALDWRNCCLLIQGYIERDPVIIVLNSQIPPIVCFMNVLDLRYDSFIPLVIPIYFINDIKVREQDDIRNESVDTPAAN